MTRRIALAVSFGVLVSSISLLAHHSAASAYDVDKKITLGTVTKLEWQNPHVFYYLNVTDPSGKVTNWSIEASTRISCIETGGGKTISRSERRSR